MTKRRIALAPDRGLSGISSDRPRRAGPGPNVRPKRQYNLNAHKPGSAFADMDQDHAQRRSFRIGIRRRRHLHQGRPDRQCHARDRRALRLCRRPMTTPTGLPPGSSRRSMPCSDNPASGRKRSCSSPTARPRRPMPCSKATSPRSGSSAWRVVPPRLWPKPQVAIGDIEVAPGKHLRTCNQFLHTDDLDEKAIRAALSDLARQGASVVVASAAFGVDNTASEEDVRRLAGEAGLLTTCGHEITRLYGLNDPHANRGDQCLDPAAHERDRRDDRGQRPRGRDHGAADDHARRRRRHGHCRDAPATGHDNAVRAGGKRGRRAHASPVPPMASTSRSAARRPTSASSGTAGRQSPMPRSAATKPMSAHSTSAWSELPAAVSFARDRAD